jgi:hypothetical protein
VPIFSVYAIYKALIITETAMLDEFEAKAKAFIKGMNTGIAG